MEVAASETGCEINSSSPDGSPCKEKSSAHHNILPKTCRVCGDTALNMNFGAVSCESCKAFFRRNALRNKAFKCPFQSKCNIDLESRRWCQQCRLRKCFEVGMKKELIQKVKRSAEDTGADSGPEDESVDQRISLSPGLRNSTPIAASSPKRIRRTKTRKVIKLSGSPVVDGNSPTEDHSRRLSVVTSEVCSPTPSAESLSSMESFSDYAVPGMEVLSGFEKEKILELIRANEVMNESNPDEEAAAVRYRERHRLVDVINMTDIAIRRLIKMTKRIAEFRSLLQEDQIALLKGACFEMMILRAVSHYNVETDCWRGPQATLISVDVLKEARGNCYEEIRTFIHSFASEFRKDEPLLLILGAIALFHPDRPALEHRGHIRAQQSLYYFLLHSYLRARYASNSQQETEALYVQMTTKIDFLHLLNDRHITMFLDLNPEHVEPLLIEIFDLKLARPAKP